MLNMGFKLRSTLTIGLLYSLIFVMLFFVDFLYEGYDVPIYLIAILSLLGIFLQYLISPIIIGWIYRIDWVSPDQIRAQLPHIFVLLENVCRTYNIHMPKFGIIHEGTPNAFTFGWSKNSSRLVITDGILDLLDSEEQRAVVGHELGHIVHNDFIVMTLVSAIPILFYTIYRLSATAPKKKSSSNHRGGSSNGGDASAYIQIAIVIGSYLMYIIGSFLTLFISRVREYWADEFSGKVTENPNSLATALVKIGYGILQEPDSTETKRVDRTQYVRALGIFDKKSARQLAASATNSNSKIDHNIFAKAAAWDLYQPWAKLFEFFSTHPLPAKRIKELSYQSFRDFKIPPKVDLSQAKVEFEKQMGKSAMDEFLGEIIIYSLPRFTFFTWIIVGVILLFTGVNFSAIPFTNYFSYFTFSIIIAGVFMLIRNAFRYNRDFKEHDLLDLIGTIKVSPIRPVPTISKGFIIGRGVPGLFYSEDFVMRDDKAIMYVDYDFGINLINRLFGIFKIEKLFGNAVEVTGWYRRGPSPFIQISEIRLLDGSNKIYRNYKRTILNIGAFIVLLFGVGLWYVTTFLITL